MSKSHKLTTTACILELLPCRAARLGVGPVHTRSHEVEIGMVNKIILAVCSTVVMAASAKIISWLQEKLEHNDDDKNKKSKKRG